MKELQVLAVTANRVWFVHEKMAAYEPEICTAWGWLEKRYPVAWWYYRGKEKDKLQLCLEVGPMPDPAMRVRLLTRIQEAGFSFPERVLTEASKFTRILSESKKLPPGEEGEAQGDDSYIGEVTAELWRRAWVRGEKIVDVLRAFDWGDANVTAPRG